MQIETPEIGETYYVRNGRNWDEVKGWHAEKAMVVGYVFWGIQENINQYYHLVREDDAVKEYSDYFFSDEASARGY